MKILQINSVCETGSTGRIVTDLYKVISQNGHECKIAYGRDSTPIDVNTIKIGNKLDIYLHVIKTRLFDKHGLGSVKASLDIVRKIKEYNPDIVHLHNIHGYYINIEILFNYLKDNGKNTVWTLHDCWAFTGHCSYFDFINCQKWEEKCHNCPQITGYPKSFLYDNSQENFIRKKKIFSSLKNLTIVTPSKWLKNKVQKSFLCKYPCIVIPNGIDVKMFSYKENKLREKFDIKDKFVILGVANIWNERKGLKYFFELSQKLNNNYVVILVGLSLKQQKQIKDTDIIGIQRTNKIEELAELYSIADVFFNPTLEDNYPTTNLEAIACKTPVITFDTGGSPESVDEKSGFVVKKGDLNSVIDIVHSLKNNRIDPGYLEKKAITSFDKNIKFNEYVKLYEKNSGIIT